MARYYCVLKSDTSRLVYAGSSESATAHALEPGTVFGVGKSEMLAWMDAIDKNRKWILHKRKLTE
jgi:hypothetical protein